MRNMNHYEQKKISVIVPVYNSEKYLVRCLDSIKSQTYSNLEIILIDDGSADNSPAICDSYAKSDSRFIVIHKKNAGVSAARNDGLFHCTGDYITFVDSDDYIDNDMYSTMISISIKHSVDIVMCDCLKEFGSHQEKYSHNIRSGYYDYEDLKNKYYPNLLITPDCEYPPAISNWLLMIKSECIKKNDQLICKYPDGVKYSEDLFFGAQVISKAKSFYYLKDKCFYHYVANDSSATHTFNPKKWDNYLMLHNKIKNYFTDFKEFDLSDQINRLLLFFLYNSVGDILQTKSVSRKVKKKIIYKILNTNELSSMFNEIKISALTISKKQKILTYCYKYKIGINFILRYYERK